MVGSDWPILGHVPTAEPIPVARMRTILIGQAIYLVPALEVMGEASVHLTVGCGLEKVPQRNLLEEGGLDTRQANIRMTTASHESSRVKAETFYRTLFGLV